jgi:cyclic dehypoxanthinyl futalosine synthase
MSKHLYNKIRAGGRISGDEALQLFATAELTSLGRLANALRHRRHPEPVVTFVVDRNVNYTNICISRCRFCAFYRDEHAPDAYLLSRKELLHKVAELVGHGGTQLLLQGGLHPRLGIDYFEELFRELRSRFPTIHIHGLSPAEISHSAALSGISLPEAIGRLQRAGLASIPGGGAEILVDRIRREISPNKIGWQEWAAVMAEAARQGLPTTATMMFGSCEEPADIIEHLLRIRTLQDAGGSFTAFIPWTYQPGNTQLGGTPATAVDYLKVLALSRLVLDNIANIQASWVTQGARLAQVALFFGANDLGGTMLEENVVAAAGCTFRMNQDEMTALIRAAGFTPAQRQTDYRILRYF